MYRHYKLKSKTTQEIFTEAYEKHEKMRERGELESVSGIGSEVCRTETIRREIPLLFDEFNVSTVLDIPCGDFNWMRNIDLSGIDYTGADIVRELIRENSDKYEKQSLRFRNLNIIKDALPKVDLVICRDCLVHFSSSDIFLALNNICNSHSGHLLTTTFPEQRGHRDILTGSWRALNLEAAPFSFPKPLKTINEVDAEATSPSDKTLGLWEISEIREILKY